VPTTQSGHIMSNQCKPTSAVLPSDADAQREIAEYITRSFGNFAELFALQARAMPHRTAIICEDESIDYAQLNARADRIAAALQGDGVAPQGAVAICGANSIDYCAAFIAILRVGAAVVPLSPSSTAHQLATMIADSGASHLFTDESMAQELAGAIGDLAVRHINFSRGGPGTPIEKWIAHEGAQPAPVAIEPNWTFNLIYSSGTTGTPKGIAQSFAMRWPHNHLANPPGYGPGAVALISTPLYSNTTLVSFLPALAGGGTVVLLPKFNPRSFLELSQRYKVNYAMLVPVQYRRILDDPEFDRFDLSNYRLKFATSAPFGADLKAEVLKRWPGGLIEYYGMTEGGGSCMLAAHEHPDKLHTVGRPMDGHELLVIDENGQIAPPGVAGEVVGRSRSMMKGYHNQPGKTAEAEWSGPGGERYIRTGDLARVDDEGFFTIVGRKKDLIVSGGVNIYPSDLEAVLIEHPAIAEAAIVGAPSELWGETPVAFVVLRASADETALQDWANKRLGKTQRISKVVIVTELPRNAIGKIVKRELQACLEFEQGKSTTKQKEES
jgi:long-chain acyl-CoA synthetase